MSLTFPLKIFSQRITISEDVQSYSYVLDQEPVRETIKITGPGAGIRLLRKGAHDFSSFSELIKTIVQPEWPQWKKVMQVYRFSARNFHSASAGWGSTEMTRFINCRGYSFCWGQADFQQLLYEAAGLRARAPKLKGHSSTEVLIDGKWRMIEAYQRMILPDLQLEGAVTGEELNRHPEIFDMCLNEKRASVAKDYWSIWQAAGTYEPWQDSRAMVLNLRRNESLDLKSDRREKWSLSPSEPTDYCTGVWSWHPTLDDEFLEKEVRCSQSLQSERGILKAKEGGGAAQMVFGVASPYPLCTGELELELFQSAGLRLEVYNQQNSIWDLLSIDLRDGMNKLSLDNLLSPEDLPSHFTDEDINREEKREVRLRMTWDHPDTECRAIRFRLTTQHHWRAIPWSVSGENHWQMIGGQSGSSVEHSVEINPSLQTSNAMPYAGEEVKLSASVYNPDTEEARDICVQFFQLRRFGEPLLLAESVLPQIKPGETKVVQASWTAAIHPERNACVCDGGKAKTYVETRIQTRIKGDPAPDSTSVEGVRSIQVLPRPRPFIDKRLTRVRLECGDKDNLRSLTIRAAVINPHHNEDGNLAYLPVSSAKGKLTVLSHHPESGGVPLRPPEFFEILCSEFSIFTWELTQLKDLEAGKIHLLAEFDAPVPESHRHQVLALSEALPETAASDLFSRVAIAGDH